MYGKKEKKRSHVPNHHFVLCTALRNALPWVRKTALLSVGHTTVNVTPSPLVWAVHQTPKTAYERALPKTIAAIGRLHQATGHTTASQGNKQTCTPHGWPVCNSETAQEHQHDAGFLSTPCHKTPLG